uniref:RNA-directed DNA polymerase n=1 Tax=Strongyloides stercoralis TaxID=6248 RepID=A0A0K0EPP4_STRER
MATRPSFQFCLTVPLFNHWDQSSNIEKFLNTLNVAFELDGVVVDRVKINVLTQRVDQATVNLLPSIEENETYEAYVEKLKATFPSTNSAMLSRTKYYQFRIDMKNFEESLREFAKAADIALKGRTDADKLESIRDRLLCQFGSRMDLYDYVNAYQGNSHSLILDLIIKYKDSLRRQKLANEFKLKNVVKKKLSNVKCYHCQIKRGLPAGDYSRKFVKSDVKEETNVNVNECPKDSQIESDLRFPKIQAKVMVNGVATTALLDGGSDVNILNVDLVKEIGLQESCESIELKTIAGTEKAKLIECPVILQMKDKALITSQRNPLYSGPTPATVKLLLGRPALATFGIIIDYESSTFSFKSQCKDCHIVLKNKCVESSYFKSQLERKYPSLISKHAYDIGMGFATAPSQDFTCTNPVKDYKVFVRKYPLPGEKEIIQTMVKHGILIPTNAVEICNYYLIDKPNTSEKRFILDCRPVNNRTRKMWSENRKTTSLINQFHVFQFASCIDLRSGYNQVNLAKEDLHKYNLQFLHQRYTYTKLPQGSTNAPIIYQKLMEDLVTPIRQKFDDDLHAIIVYLDDILILSNTSMSEHKNIISYLCQHFSNKNVKLNWSKCIFLNRTICFLGWKFCGRYLCPEPESVPEKMKVLPTTKSMLYKWLQTLNYYRISIENYASKTSILYELIGHKKSQTIQWTNETIKAYQEIVSLVYGKPRIFLRDHSKMVVMEVDASQTSIGAVLLQESDCPEKEEILYRESLSKSKKERSATYLELYSIKKSLIFFAPLISQETLEIYSDHKPLKKVLENNITPRYVDLVDTIASFSIKLRYINGKSNMLADLLSRMFSGENFESNHVEINSLSKSDKLAKFLFDKFHRENSHMSYGKMKEDIVTELQGRKLSNYTNIEVLDKLIHLIKECEICNQNNPLKRKKKVRTMPNTVLKIVYGDFA